MTALGLPVHEVQAADSQAELLGWEINRKQSRIRPTRRRVWKNNLAVQALLTSRKTSSKTTERLIGHMSFVALLRRDTLACFEEVYKYIKQDFSENHFVWESVLRELDLFSNLLPLIVVDWNAGWSDAIHMCDASGEGLGVVASRAPVDEVRSAGSVREKWRWKHEKSDATVMFNRSASHLQVCEHYVCPGSDSHLLSPKLFQQPWSLVMSKKCKNRRNKLSQRVGELAGPSSISLAKLATTASAISYSLMLLPHFLLLPRAAAQVLP